MNVRERAKTFEAFMSSNNDSVLPESERKRSSEEAGGDLSGSTANNGVKEPDQEKQKPVPPPRKARKIKPPARPESSQSRQSTSPRPSPGITQPTKPKIAPKKPPPPRPAPYKQLSSPSLTSHIPHAKTKELSASLSRRREASEAKAAARPLSSGSPVAPRKTQPRDPPTKPSRGSPKSSPSSSQTITRSSPKRSSCEIQLTHGPKKVDSPRGDSPEKTSKGDSLVNSSKGNPQRPPPPKRTSSLSRKIKPPVPPKPNRLPKTKIFQERKAATIPRTSSIESKDSISTAASEEDLVSQSVETKRRSLSTPIVPASPTESDLASSEENGNNHKIYFEESSKALNTEHDDSLPHVNGVKEPFENSNVEPFENSNVGSKQSVSQENENQSSRTDNIVVDRSENVENTRIPSEEETYLPDTGHDRDSNLESSLLDKNENGAKLETTKAEEIIDSDITINEESEEKNIVENENIETVVKDEKLCDSQSISDEANKNLNLSSTAIIANAEGQPEDSSNVEEDKPHLENEVMDVVSDESKENTSFEVSEPMETNIDDLFEENDTKSLSDKDNENATENDRTSFEGNILCENEKSIIESSNAVESSDTTLELEDSHESENIATDSVMEVATINDNASEQIIEHDDRNVSYHVDESDLSKEKDTAEDQIETFVQEERSLDHSGEQCEEPINADERLQSLSHSEEQPEEATTDVDENFTVETSPFKQDEDIMVDEEIESNNQEDLPSEQSQPDEKELVKSSMTKDDNLEAERNEVAVDSPVPDVESASFSMTKEENLEFERNEVLDASPVPDVESSSFEINSLLLNNAKDNVLNESNVSTTPQSYPEEEKRSSYMETSLDEEFFHDEDTTQEHLEDRQDLEVPLDEPYETEIDLEVVGVIEDCKADQSSLMTDPLIATEIELPEASSEESTSSKASERAFQYENVTLPTDMKQEGKELRPEPVKPARPSRQKKKKHLYENTSLPQVESTVVKVEKEEVAEEPPRSSSPAIPSRTNVYENTSIKLQEEVEVTALTAVEASSKRNDVYENTVIVAQIMQTQEEEKENNHSKSLTSTTLKPEKTSSQRQSKQPSYENVVLPNDDTFEDDDSIYQVPRRKSFSSESPTTSFERSSKRSASVGSMERKKGGKNVLQTFQTEAASTYVVPTARSSSHSEEVYVTPRSIQAVSDEMYVTPKSLTEDVYVAPRSIRTSSDPEDMYAAPREVIAADAEETYVAPKAVRSASAKTLESEYHVPSSPSKEKSPSEEYKVPVSPPKTRSATVGSGSAVIITEEPFLDEEPRLRRATRSSVLTSREQVKAAPAKPPRLSDADLSEQPEEKPKPMPRTLDNSPKASPRPKPRKSQDHSTGELHVEEKTVNEPPTEVVSDNASASPKPKRPAPPRPKAPSISVVSDKSSTAENDSETRHRPPPRPPPPALNRVSVLSSEQESIPGSPMESSSESEEEEQAPVTKGPPKKKTYHIAHEILSTERTFVTALTLCYEDCYGLIKAADVVLETTLNDIFKDLGNIYHLDVKFLNELEDRMKTWEQNERIGDIVKRYSYFLKMYTTYINHYDKAISVLQETTKENLQFAELVQEFQASQKCQGLFLESFMLKPVQRIPSYRLLLIDYLKHLPQDSDEFKDIKVALDIVSEVATHINESMKKSDNFGKVLRLQENIVGNAEIVKPGREFIKEGTLQKLCRKDMQERTFFLLTDVLLYTNAVGSGQYRLKGTFPLLGVKVELPDSPEFENEFSIISKSRSFTLSASTQAERDEWIAEINGAISALTKKKSTFMISKDGAVVPPAEGEVEESKLGDKAPVWIQDTRVTMCMLCTDKFTVTNRRHHCRGCGKVVCGSCSDNLAPLAYLDYAQARVCEVCYEVLLKEQNKSIKESAANLDQPPPSPVGIGGDDLEGINRKPPKFEILHRFKPGSKKSNRRSKIITTRSSVRTEVVGHDSESQMSGYLRFKRTNKHGWKRLWFVLKDNVLYTYKASEDVVAMETIPVLGYVVQEATRTEGDEIQFQLKHAGLPPISFKTETESSAFRWIQELKKATTL